MQKNFVMHFLLLGIFMGLLVIGVYVYDLIAHGWSWGETLNDEDFIHLHASTMAFATLVLIQMVNAFNARSSKFSVFKLKTNLFLWASVTISVIMVAMMIYVPWFKDKMHTTALSAWDWSIVIGVSLSVLFFEEVRKNVRR